MSATIFIGLSMAGYFTYEFLVSLRDGKGSLRPKLWKWMKNVFDAITGIG
jgi:hypothetical protein